MREKDTVTRSWEKITIFERQECTFRLLIATIVRFLVVVYLTGSLKFERKFQKKSGELGPNFANFYFYFACQSIYIIYNRTSKSHNSIWEMSKAF